MSDYEDQPEWWEIPLGVGIMMSRALICIGAPVGLLATACVMMGAG